VWLSQADVFKRAGLTAQISGTTFVKAVESLKTLLIALVLGILTGLSTLINENHRHHQP